MMCLRQGLQQQEEQQRRGQQQEARQLLVQEGPQVQRLEQQQVSNYGNNAKSGQQITQIKQQIIIPSFQRKEKKKIMHI